MERKSRRCVSEYLICKKMREALATFPGFGAISKRFSLQHRQNSKTVAVDSQNSPPPSSPHVIRTVHIQAKPQDLSSSSTETIPINFDYTVPAPRISATEKKDLNSVFGDYIRHTKDKITSESNVAGKGQGDTSVDDKDGTYYKDHGAKKKDSNQSENFSNFIHRSRRKIRTISGIRRG